MDITVYTNNGEEYSYRDITGWREEKNWIIVYEKNGAFEKGKAWFKMDSVECIEVED